MIVVLVVFSVNNSFHTLSKSEEKAQGRSTVNINKHKIRKTNKHFPLKWGEGGGGFVIHAKVPHNTKHINPGHC